MDINLAIILTNLDINAVTQSTHKFYYIANYTPLYLALKMQSFNFYQFYYNVREIYPINILENWSSLKLNFELFLYKKPKPELFIVGDDFYIDYKYWELKSQNFVARGRIKSFLINLSLYETFFILNYIDPEVYHKMATIFLGKKFGVNSYFIDKVLFSLTHKDLFLYYSLYNSIVWFNTAFAKGIYVELHIMNDAVLDFIYVYNCWYLQQNMMYIDPSVFNMDYYTAGFFPFIVI